MKFYSFDKIKAAADCRLIAKDIGLELDASNRCAASWRGGDNPTAVTMNKDGYHDFVKEESGSVIDLVSLVMFAGDKQQAQNWLGEKLGLEPDMVPVKELPGNSHYDKMITDGYAETRRHIYSDEVGNQAHYVARLEHPTKKKQFVQGANGRWGVKGVKLFPYNLQRVLMSQRVWICEGEKAAEALIERGEVATTNVSGAGKWKADYNQYFQGKSIAILPDNDPEGAKHAKQVAKALFGIASDIRIVTTSKKDKGDVFDWFEENQMQNNVPSLIELVKAVPEITEADLVDADDVKEDTEIVVTAKEANKYEFRNYWPVKEVGNGGKVTIRKDPIHINKIIENVHKRFLGFPRKVGEVLFDHDKDSHKLYYINKQSTLFSWISRKSKQLIDWSSVDKTVSMEQLYEGIHAEATQYQSVSLVPDWPHRDDVYYAHKPIPQSDPDHKYFNKLVSFFNPTSDAFATALKAFVIAPIFYRSGIPRPVWIIQSDVAGSGKTTLANMVAMLYGKPPIEVKQEAFKRDMESTNKRLVSAEGRLSKIFLVDNVTGVFKSEEFSGLTTMPFVSGLAPYGRGEESRPNNLTYVITANNAQIDNDIAIRSYFIDLKQIEYSTTWNYDIQTFINTNRLKIFADILDILNSHSPYRFGAGSKPTTRCPEFETQVLQAVCKDVSEYSAVLERIISTRGSANVDEELGKEVEDSFRVFIQDLKLNPDENTVWITSNVVQEWGKATFPDMRGNVVQFIKGLSKEHHAPHIYSGWDTFPRSGDGRRRGVLWLNKSGDKTVHRIIVKKGRQITYISTPEAPCDVF